MSGAGRENGRHGVDNRQSIEGHTVQVGQILAVGYTEDPARLVATNVAGFAWVQHVDLTDSSLTIMCPHGIPPPTNCFLAGAINRSLDLVTM
jgi:hypothetical protein